MDCVRRLGGPKSSPIFTGRPASPRRSTFYPGVDHDEAVECLHVCGLAAAAGWHAGSERQPGGSWIVSLTRAGDRTFSGQSMDRREALMGACRAWKEAHP